MFALDGVRLIDFGQYLAGPFGPMVIGDLGADVIKIEPPTGDYVREMTWPIVEGTSLMHLHLNRGKRSVVLDLKDSHGRRAFDLLLDRADVFVHNQGPGAAQRLGVTFPELHQRNARLIACAISGYGPDGPHRDRKAVYDKVKAEYAAKGLVVLNETPFQNTYNMVVRPETAAQYRLETLTDLAKVSKELKLGAGPEFRDRKDGLPGLKAKYGMEFKEDLQMAIGLRYQALKGDAVKRPTAWLRRERRALAPRWASLTA